MRIGFTGTQAGMTPAQLLAVAHIFNAWYAQSEEGLTVHHGDCLGADAEFHGIVRQHATVEGHPCTIETKRAHCDFDFEYPARPPLDRNWDIVTSSDIVIAAPGQAQEQLRSGTWATVRYARKARKPVVIVDPDGTVHAPEDVIL